MSRLPAALLALAVAFPAAAETYKWVDAQGVVNYSNTPPAGVKAAKPIPEDARVSTIESDAATKAAAAQRGPSYYELALEREWTQRQRLMAMEKAAAPAPCTPYDYFSCGYYDDRLNAGYGYPLPVHVVPVIRPTRVISTPVNPNPPSKARLMQLQR